MKVLKWVLRAPLYVLRVAALVATLFFLYQWAASPFQDFAIQRHSFWFLPSIGIQAAGAYLIYAMAKEKSDWLKAAYATLAVGSLFVNQMTTFHWWVAALLIIVYPFRGTSLLLAVAGAGFVFHVLVGLFGGEPFSIEVLLVAVSMAVFSATHLYLSRKGEEEGHGDHDGGNGKKDDSSDGGGHTTPPSPEPKKKEKKDKKKGHSPGMPGGAPW